MSRKWHLSDISIPKTFTGALESLTRALERDVPPCPHSIFTPVRDARDPEIPLTFIDPKSVRFERPYLPLVRAIRYPTGDYTAVNSGGQWLMTKKIWYPICRKTKWVQNFVLGCPLVYLTAWAFPQKQRKFLEAIRDIDYMCRFNRIVRLYFDLEESSKISYVIHMNLEPRLRVAGTRDDMAALYRQAAHIYKSHFE